MDVKCTPDNNAAHCLRDSLGDSGSTDILLGSYQITSQDAFGTPVNEDTSWLRCEKGSQVPSESITLHSAPVSVDEGYLWLRSSKKYANTPVPRSAADDSLCEGLLGTPINDDTSWLSPSPNIETIPPEMMEEYQITSQDAFGTAMQSESNSVPSTPINVEYEELLDHKVRSVYLITYSQADTERFDRKSFAEAVVTAFNQGKAKVVKWVCALENHSNGGKHFHVAVHLSKIKRWKSVKQTIMDKYGIVLHFSDFHNDYSDAWHYVTKEDQNCIQSVNHPQIVRMTAPRTRRATAQRKSVAKGNKNGKEKVKRLTHLAFTQIIRKENIIRLGELYSFIKKEELSFFITVKKEK